MYEDTDQYTPYEEEEQLPPDNIISTSQAINLTSTLASLSGLFGLFLCFADQRSHAVRRFSVQSVGLLVAHVAVGMACWWRMSPWAWPAGFSRRCWAGFRWSGIS